MTESAFELRCPKCSVSIMATVNQAGQKIECPRCQNKLLVPGHSPTSDQQVSVDDLIDFNDDIMNPGQEAVEITAQVVEEVAENVAAPGDAMVDDQKDDALALAVEPDEKTVEIEPDDSVDDSLVDVLDEPDEDLDDLLPVPDIAPPVTAENKDPFEFDDEADLRIEGITPQDNQFPIICPLCGTLIYARVSQVGTQLKCPDCYSLVDVEEPKETPEPSEFPIAEPDDDGAFRLSEPVELPRIETTIDGDVDYDDDEFFEKLREQEQQEPEAVVVVQPEPRADAGAGYGLAPPEEDLLKPQVTTPTFDDPAAASPPPANQPVPGYQDAAKTVSPGPVPEDVPAQVEPEGPSHRTGGKSGEDIPGPFSNLGEWIGQCLTPFRDWQSLIRLTLFAIFLGVGYLIVSSGASSFTEDTNQLQKFGGFAVISFGGVFLALVLFMVGVTGNGIVRVALEQRGKMGEWPDFSLADWMSQFLYLGTSFWIAVVPGLLIGELIWLGTSNPYLMFLTAVASSLMLAPFFLASVVYNESPWQVFAPEVMGSLGALKFRWLRFFTAAFLISVLLTISLPGVLHGTLGFVMALMQLSLLYIYYWMLGDITRHIVEWMSRQAEAAVG
ncbi:MAG: hypothetical protein ACR2NP_02535 [Pirellulaceae bacterium]